MAHTDHSRAQGSTQGRKNRTAAQHGDSGVSTKTVKATIDEREQTHGDFKEVACIAQNLREVLHAWFGWSHLDHVQRESLDSIMGKVARIMSGNPNFRDHWHDIQGYAKLAEDRCKP